MKPPLLGSIGRRMFFWMILVSFVPLILLGFRGYSLARDAFTTQSISRIEAVAAYKHTQVDAWLNERQHELLRLYASHSVMPEVKAASTDESGFTRFAILPAQTTLNSGFLNSDDSVWVESIKVVIAQHAARSIGSQTYFLPPGFSSTAGTTTTMILVNATDEAGRFDCVAGELMISKQLDNVLIDSAGLGKSGQSYLVDENRVMLTRSRFMNHPNPGTHKMESPATDSGFAVGRGGGSYFSWEGKSVLGAWEPITGPNWLLVAEIDANEALGTLETLKREWSIAAIVSLFGIIIAAWLLSSSISRPILSLASSSRIAASGDLTIRSRLNGDDEIGRLGAEFDQMLDVLQLSEATLKRSLYDLQEKEKLLIQSERLAAVGEIVASIVHELRNPLTTIKVNLRLLARKVGHDSPEAMQLVLMEEQSLRLEKMLNDLLNYSKPITLNVSEFNLNELLASVIDSARERGIQENITIQLTHSGESSIVNADREVLFVAFDNLVTNGIQAMPESGGLIDISLKSDLNPNLISVFVKDGGRGIPEETIKRIFEPFFTTKPDGVGLGLPNVKKYISMHSGELTINSIVGKGTTVRVDLPRRPLWL